MTRTGPAGVAMSACGHASVGRPVLARPALVSVWPLSHEPIVVGAVFPGSASFKPASGRWSGRSADPGHTRLPSPLRCSRTGPSGHWVVGRRVRRRPHSRIRFTCTCPSGLAQQYL